MVAGIHKYLDRMRRGRARRNAQKKSWKGDKAARERFKKMLGLVDKRVSRAHGVHRRAG